MQLVISASNTPPLCLLSAPPNRMIVKLADMFKHYHSEQRTLGGNYWNILNLFFSARRNRALLIKLGAHIAFKFTISRKNWDFYVHFLFFFLSLCVGLWENCFNIIVDLSVAKNSKGTTALKHHTIPVFFFFSPNVHARLSWELFYHSHKAILVIICPQSFQTQMKCYAWKIAFRNQTKDYHHAVLIFPHI